MLELYLFHSPFEFGNPSPFCMKMQTYLQLAHIPYSTHIVNNPRTAPKGKLPYIKDRGKVIADSSLIIEYLQKEYGEKLDYQLTPHQKALAIAVQRMLEDHYYWVLIYMRWLDPVNKATLLKAFFSNVPSFIRLLLPPLIRSDLKKGLWKQGLGRHTAAEIYQFGIQDLTALADLLTPGNFFFGDKPTSIDACIYAFVANTGYTPFVSPVKDFALQRPELVAYYAKMKNYLLSLT